MQPALSILPQVQGSTPGGRLYYLAHTLPMESTPQVAWDERDEWVASGLAFVREQTRAAPERHLDFLAPGAFFQTDTEALRAFGERHDPHAQRVDSPFGTQCCVEFTLPSAPWNGWHNGAWTVRTDGVHFLAELQLDSVLDPVNMQALDLPTRLMNELRDALGTEPHLDRFVLGWNWHPQRSSSRAVLPGMIYRVRDTSLVGVNAPNETTNWPTFVGTDLDRFLPQLLSDVVTLSQRSDSLTSRLTMYGWTPLVEPAQPGETDFRVLQARYEELHAQRLLVEGMEEALAVGRAWQEGVESLIEHGFERKMPLSHQVALAGPFQAVMAYGHPYTLTPSRDVASFSGVLSTGRLPYAVAAVERFKNTLNRRLDLSQSAIEVQTALGSYEATKDALKVAENSLDVAQGSLTSASEGVKWATKSFWIAIAGFAVSTFFSASQWLPSQKEVQPSPSPVEVRRLQDFGVKYPASPWNIGVGR